MKPNPFFTLLSFFCFTTFSSSGQVPFTSDLYKEIMHHDSIVFELGYNQCQLDRLAAVVAEDFEMYHDITGASQGKEIFLHTFKQNICSTPGRKSMRKLTPHSVTVFPLYQHGEMYGAVQHGEHGFGIIQPDGQFIMSTKARFTHLWLRDEAHGWLLKRVLSYDHHR